MFKPIQTALLTCLLALLLPQVSNAQTCKPESIPATASIRQLTDNGDGTVTDAKTGLMWKQCSEGLSGAGCAIGSAQTYTWQAALAQAQRVNDSGGFAGKTGWRLPNAKELHSITEKQCYNPAINLVRFPNTDPYVYFWSASPFARDGDYAWNGDFFHGNINTEFKYETLQVRLVRDIQSVVTTILRTV